MAKEFTKITTFEQLPKPIRDGFNKRYPSTAVHGEAHLKQVKELTLDTYNSFEEWNEVATWEDNGIFLKSIAGFPNELLSKRNKFFQHANTLAPLRGGDNGFTKNFKAYERLLVVQVKLIHENKYYQLPDDWEEKLENLENFESFWNKLFQDKNFGEAEAEITDLRKRPDITEEEHNKLKEAETNLGKWVNAFPDPLTPEQVKAKYDEQKETHTDDDLKPADWEEQVKNADEAKENLAKWTDAFGKDKTPTDIKNDLNKAESGLDEWKQTFPEKTAEQTKNDFDDLRNSLVKVSKENVILKVNELTTKFSNSITLETTNKDIDDLYGKDWQELLKDNLTFDNLDKVDNYTLGIKAVAVKVATDKLFAKHNELEDILNNKSREIDELEYKQIISDFELVKKQLEDYFNWSDDYQNDNNPLYLKEKEVDNKELLRISSYLDFWTQKWAELQWQNQTEQPPIFAY